ncbi:hypothetical protein NLM24_04705 [Nocardia zapadnayensis]|nr:hypothetical protein [Nocardia zapadnayensis]MCX0270019.1 hypothetical protein [Nocardia zapadnayensis]
MSGGFRDREADDAARSELDSMTPEQIEAMVDRLVFIEGPCEVDLAPDTDDDRRPGMWPRPVAMSDELELRSQLRASSLGLSRSAYIRWLVERDLNRAYGEDA